MSHDARCNFDVGEFVFPYKGGLYHTTIVRAGYLGTERIVPPAGEGYAFELPRWRNKVEVTCSPTGRSVQVFVNGEKWAAVRGEDGGRLLSDSNVDASSPRRGEGAPTRKGGDGTATASSPSPPPTT